jgi:glycerol uptake facilitator-like aquaporin
MIMSSCGMISGYSLSQAADLSAWEFLYFAGRSKSDSAIHWLCRYGAHPNPRLSYFP